jgi:hypothetical protein
MVGRMEPIHKIPLTRSNMTALGRFAVIFGQIDHYLTHLLCHLLYLDIPAGYQAMETMTTGVKVNALRKSLPRIEDDETRRRAKEFVENIGGLIERRNHMLHGIWGWHIRDDGTLKPGCHFAKAKGPLYPEKLEEYANGAAKLSYEIHAIYCAVVGTDTPPPENPNPKYCFGEKAVHETLQRKGIRTAPIGRFYKGHRDQG